MPNDTPPRADAISPAALVAIPNDETVELIALALNLTKGRVRQVDIAREANRAVADRLLEYFRQSGIVLMRPPPREAHSNNPKAGQSDALRRSRRVPDAPCERYRPTVRVEAAQVEPEGLTTTKMSGVDDRELAALNHAHRRLIDAGSARN